MTCSTCGGESRPGARFCEECGARLDAVCPACGAPVTPGKRFCAGCGARLTPPDAVAPGPAAGDPRFAPPVGYTPPHLAERILRDRTVLQGERKQVTVLFADVSGFTGIAEGLDPEEVHGLMNRAFELMLGAVHRYEGTVNQFLGDGLMALFGAPVAHEDHARRAALAALDMRAALSAYADDLRARHGIVFRVRMGLNTGLVVVGSIGDNLRMDYTAVGDTTNVAARMQQRAEPGQIVVADATRRLVEPHFELAALGTVAVKNRLEPVGAWSLVGARAAPAPRTLSPFVGREAELEALVRAARAAAGDRRGRGVYLVGEPGMGKSRLLWELRRRVGDEMEWLEGHCVSWGQSSAFLPFTEVLRGMCGISAADGEAEAAEKVDRTLAELGAAAEGIAPYVRFALSLDCGDPAVSAMDPNERLGRLLQAASRLTQLRSHRRPLILVIEDLHWIDPGSEQYLKQIVDNLPGVAGLLVLTWRPSYQPPFVEHTYVSRIALDPLDDGAARRMVGAGFGVPDLPELAAVVARRAEGNPFFLEEIVRALRDTGAVTSEDGRLALTRPLSAIQVPDRVQDVIAARIDRLSEPQKRTLQLAAVIGREFPLRLLRRVAETPDDVERRLGELKALEFVYEKPTGGDPEYVFKHALTQDVAYESILLARRREIHARLGRAIEALHAERLDERAEELAHHFLRGEVWDRAARYARQAGERAAAFCLDAKAADFYERALEALARLPEDAGTAALGIDLRLTMRAPLWRGGQLDRLYQIYKDAEALAERHGQTDRLDAVYAFFAQYHWAKGQQGPAITYGERCLAAAERRNDLGLRVTAHYYLGWSHYVLGRFRTMLEHEDRILALLEGPRALERFGLSGLPYTGACGHAALALLELGEAAQALGYVERGERVAEVAQHLYSSATLALARGVVLLELGRNDEALASLEATVALCRERRFAGQLMLALAAVARAYSRAGRHEEAIAASLEAVRVKDATRAPVTRGHHVESVALAYLGAGRLDEAEAAAREAIEWATRLEERPWVGWGECTLGEVLARRGERAAAAPHYAAALTIARELGMRPLAERCERRLAGTDVPAASVEPADR